MHKLTDFQQLTDHFWRRMTSEVVPKLKTLNKSVMVGEALIVGQDGPDLSTVPPDAVVEVWGGRTMVREPNGTLRAVLAAGHRAILGGPFYLCYENPSMYSGQEHKIPTPGMWVDTWKVYYNVEPFDAGLTTKMQSLILGLEAEEWGEQTNPLTVVQRAWPRTLAVAERSWSAKDVVNLLDAEARINRMSCHLNRRGIPSSPTRPGHCTFAFDFGTK